MSSGTSPKHSYHLCPDFSISPPPDGHLTLGSILKNLDVDGFAHPLNLKSEVPIADDDIYPKNVPDSKNGFTRTLKELRAIEGSIWAKIFSLESIGVSLGFLRKRTDDETLSVEDLQTRYFSPSEEYMHRSLETANVASFVNVTKRKIPIYMVTGLKVAYGAKLSKATMKTRGVDGKMGVADPQGQASGGGSGSYNAEESAAVAFTGSTPFILGIRVRKIWWEKGVRQTSDKVAGTTLDDNQGQRKKGTSGEVKWADDFTVIDGIATDNELFTNHSQELGMEVSDWVL